MNSQTGVRSGKTYMYIIAALIVIAGALVGAWWLQANKNTARSATVQREYSSAELASHASADSCFVVVGGNVYDLTSWIAEHPGGRDAIIGLCGTDGTAAFSQQHGSNREAQKALASFKIGSIKTSN